ncbi:gamma-aminobutyric acid (GABA(A)) receptor-associated protein-like 1, isoform CRA_b, partial [Mus musculus]
DLRTPYSSLSTTPSLPPVLPWASCMRTTTRKTIFCMWPTVMKVSMENEAEAQQMGAPGLGGRGGVRVGLGEPEGGLPTMEETQGEDIGKHHTAHAVVFFSQAQLLLFSASSAQEELVLHWL